MDDKITEKLKRVFEVFTESNTNIKDDTTLNKLIDYLTTKLQNPKDIKTCCIPRFLSCVKEKKTSTEIFVFGLHLAGILATKSELSQQYEQDVVEVLQTASSHDLIAEPSVGEALFTVLESLPVSMICPLKDLLSTTWKIFQEKSSLFLQKAALKFVTSLFQKHSNDSEIRADLEIYVDILWMQIFKISSPTTSNGECYGNSNFPSICLEILKTALAVEGWHVYIIRKFTDCTNTLLKILEFPDKGVFDSCLKSLLISAKYIRDDKQELERFGVKMMDSVEKLVATDVFKVQEVCFGMMNFGLWPEHYEWMTKMIRIPLHLVVSMDTGSEKMLSTIQNVKDQMNSRTKAVKILCSTVDKISSLNLKDEGVQEMVMKMLEMTTEEYTGIQSSDIQPYLLNSHRIQQKCFEWINQDSGPWLPYKENLLGVVIRICQNSRIDIVTYTKCLDCIQWLLPHILLQREQDETFVKDGLSRLAFILQKHTCGLSWEQREATIGFLKNFVTHYKDKSHVMSWFKDNRFDVSVWQCLVDSESYVRSSAIECVVEILLCPVLHDHLLESLSMTLEKMVEEVENICRTDSEAFVRRSAVTFFSKLWEHNLLSEKSIGDILLLFSEFLINDFDWEVKLNVLEFWSLYFDRMSAIHEEDVTYSQYTESLISLESMKVGFCKLVTVGCIKALFSMVEDYDQSVVEKTLHLLQKIKSVYELTNLQADITKLFEEEHIAFSPTKECFSVNTQQKEVILSFISKLLALDIDQELSKFSQTGDEYERNPGSLLDDILLYAGLHDHPEDDESTVIDCY